MVTLQVRDMRFPSRSLKSVIYVARLLRIGFMIGSYKGVNPPVMVGLGEYGSGDGKYMARKAGIFGVDIWGLREFRLARIRSRWQSLNMPIISWVTNFTISVIVNHNVREFPVDMEALSNRAANQDMY